MKSFPRLRSGTQLARRAGSWVPLLLCFAWSLNSFGQTVSLWKEGFETDDFWDRWHVEGGVWAVGTPSSGPNQAFAGSRCAATVLDGDYPPNADARLVRDQVFIVPAASDQPRLRFWNWYQGAPGDTPTVEIKVGTGSWQPIAALSGLGTNSWNRAFFDLSPFSGQPVEIAFHFQSNGDANVGPGWYIDEVTVETGSDVSTLLTTPEGFEAGLGSWTVDHGSWAVGPPDPIVGAFDGTNCVGTVLNGNYFPKTDSRLISPEFAVPAATENPRLRFWHWFSIWPGDYGQVDISVGGGAWQPLSRQYSDNSSVWTRPALDLTPYAGQTVQIAFHFQSDLDTNVGLGWYIDDVFVETGPMNWDPVKQPEGFESGLGDWSVDNGSWEVGMPTFGPTSGASGVACAGTVLRDRYTDNVDSRLISPVFTVPAASDHPRLHFWQWLRNQPGDPATVEIRPLGGDWQALSGSFTALDGTWAPTWFALDAFAGQGVQVAFHFQSNNDRQVDAGWYVDEVSVETGPLQVNFLNQVESFEGGFGDWSVDHGTWQVGPPDTYPPSAYSGTNCVGTILDGNYGQGIDSRLISPPFVVPDAGSNPRLRFWHWYSIWPGDFGQVEISLAGGPWQAISDQITLNGVVWSRPWFDLRPFAGQSARLAFHFQSDTDNNVGRGWYIDDVIVETGPMDLSGLNTSEGFENGLENWAVDHGTWEIGTPIYGPGQAFKGTNCAATVLRVTAGKYLPNTDSRLISPEFTVPCVEAGPRLRFAQWYDIAAGDQGSVEVRVAGGDWQSIIGPISGTSGAWITGFYDLSPYAGQRIQIAFRFQSNDDDQVGAGWYIDEVKIQATVLQAPAQASVPEGTLFTYSFGTPCQNLRFSLGSGAPDGAQIDPVLGILAWLPTEEQGPGVYPLQICVSDINNPFTPVECVTMQITVQEVNSPPVIDPIGPQVIAADVPIQFTVTAYDPDIPSQTLTFSLDQGAPYGANVDPKTGLFTWTPDATQATTQYSITVRVTDNGTPPLSATTTFTAAPSGPVSEVLLRVAAVSNGQITLCMDGGTLGTMYSLETTISLTPLSGTNGWTVLQTFWKGEQTYCATTTAAGGAARFFRIRRIQ
jgi:hypothetical protein